MEACPTFVTPSSFTGEGPRRRQTIHLSLENSRSVSGLVYDCEVAAVAEQKRGIDNSGHGVAVVVLGGDLVDDTELDGGMGWFGGYMVSMVMVLRNERDGSVGNCYRPW